MNNNSKLSDFFLEKARTELGEDEETKKRAIEELQAWVKCQPNIRNFQEGELLFLAFLRAKKYVIPKALRLLKNFLHCPKNYPQYFKNLDVSDPTITALLDTGLVVVAPKRDQGSLVVIYRPGVIDPKRFSPVDCFRFEIAVIQHFLFEEKTQVGGAINIYDFRSFPKSLLTFLTFSHYKDWFRLMADVLPVRIKGLYVVGLPSFATNIFEWGTGILHTNLKERLRFTNTFEEMKSFFDLELLPMEFSGSSVPMQDQIDSLKVDLLKNRDRILALNDIMDFNMDPGNVEDPDQEIEVGVAGSFKKLEFD